MVLTGRIKPYVRMTQKGKYVDPQAAEYLASKQALQLQMKTSMNADNYERFANGIPLLAYLSFHVPSSQGHRADLDNLIKAVLDAGNDILYEDDRWIDNIRAHRNIIDNSFKEPGVYITIEPLEKED